MSDPIIKEFARKHAPAMAEKMTDLFGELIAKSLPGILERYVEMQHRINALEAKLQEHGIPLPKEP